MTDKPMTMEQRAKLIIGQEDLEYEFVLAHLTEACAEAEERVKVICSRDYANKYYDIGFAKGFAKAREEALDIVQANGQWWRATRDEIRSLLPPSEGGKS